MPSSVANRFITASTILFLSGNAAFALVPSKQSPAGSALLSKSRRHLETSPGLAGSAYARESQLSSRARSAVPLMAAAAASDSQGSTVTASIINLSKNIVGSGILALAGGVAAFSASPMGVLPALAVLFFLGAASGYSFSLIARVGDETGAATCKYTNPFTEPPLRYPAVVPQLSLRS